MKIDYHTMNMVRFLLGFTGIFLVTTCVMQTNLGLNLTTLVREYYPTNIPFGEHQYFESSQYLKLHNICQTPPKRQEFDNLINELEKEFGQTKVKDYSLLHDNNPSYIIRIVTYLEGDNVESFVINISVIADYFAFYVSSITKENDRNYFEQYFNFESAKYVEMKKYISKKIKALFPEYEELPASRSFVSMPNISVGNKAIGEATLFDCLFTDHIW